MKKLLNPNLLVLLVVICFGIFLFLILKQDESMPTLLEVSESEVDGYLENYTLDANYEMLDFFITDDKLLYYALLQKEESGMLLRITKTQDGYYTNQTSLWELSNDPISILELDSNNHHSSKLLVGIVKESSIETVSFLEENNKEIEFLIQGKSGFIQPIDESIIEVKAFDKMNKKLWDSGNIYE
ncbi:hypothetical protein J27TS8_29960 [Robertmurraya siralis]|uniref:Uncharacterized protein n=1 Tax=Robertmurraya siralis TaxID=77777 RepID=A0A920BUJ6_9BACI|nr:hypothetical protein [Robertmurraya siralis]PAE19711.1 hypothetical protein CHH80_15165 [Bacillus sp. 7504-2]GIN63003.1 hypothetical protein J27TS8_29960 [Robertmurraya siralis]